MTSLDGTGKYLQVDYKTAPGCLQADERRSIANEI